MHRSHPRRASLLARPPRRQHNTACRREPEERADLRWTGSRRQRSRFRWTRPPGARWYGRCCRVARYQPLRTPTVLRCLAASPLSWLGRRRRRQIDVCRQREPSWRPHNANWASNRLNDSRRMSSVMNTNAAVVYRITVGLGGAEHVCAEGLSQRTCRPATLNTLKYGDSLYAAN
ncbi:hypothetical protein BD413DRAFT_545979 [Trametes elegans]|nr:hypothetical protein BD413DRAFT_545979 [Trametes elegans]